ncbi:MAG TPA: squalene/phytoene synthase family protein [Cyclobacteriaceae bacterium]|nr:squalene/phytoene synthase family protein [Cyclobacteriaceae bacterium]
MNDTREIFLDKLESIDFKEIDKHPNILIAARFWEEERYYAAKTCYKFMRSVDDMIDDHKSAYNQIGKNDQFKFEEAVIQWILNIRNRLENPDTGDEFSNTIQKFGIPLWPFEDFARSMVYDIHHDGFRNLSAFLEYSQGASVAPASVFVHLCGISDNSGGYLEPEFDVREAATPCAMFSYLVHIIRDFQKDQLANLNYFADEEMERNGLTRKDLRNMALDATVNNGFRAMISGYYLLADDYRKKTQEMIRKISPLMKPRYQLSLDIIFSLYLMVFERIDIKRGNFTKEELEPSAEEIRARVQKTILEFQPAQRLMKLTME